MINRLFLLGNGKEKIVEFGIGNADFGINRGKEKIMKNSANSFKQVAIFSLTVFLASLFILSIPAAAKKPWDGVVHAPLKTAKSFDWSAPDEFFTGRTKGTPFRSSVFMKKSGRETLYHTELSKSTEVCGIN